MKGRLAVLGAVVALSTTACHWNWYESTHITYSELTPELRKVIGEVTGATADRGGYAIGVAIGTGDVVLDTNCVDDGICTSQIGADYAHYHEAGHIVARDLGFPWGSSVIEQEQQANCFAELALGRDPAFTYPDQGYWNCPQDRVDALYDLMVQKGFAERGDFPIPQLIPPISVGG